MNLYDAIETAKAHYNCVNALIKLHSTDAEKYRPLLEEAEKAEEEFWAMKCSKGFFHQVLTGFRED